MTLTDRHYCLSEVRLEDGFATAKTVIGTRTALYTGDQRRRIAAIHAANASCPPACPAIRRRASCCCRRSATCTSTWTKPSTAAHGEAPRPRQGKTIMDMIALEQTLIPKLLPTSQQRAENLIALLQSKAALWRAATAISIRSAA